MTSSDVRLATREDRDRVVATVVAAFVEDPAFRHFFPDEESYAEQAAVFAGYLFDERVGLGTVWVVEDGVAVAMWEPPNPPHGGSPQGLSRAVSGRMRRYDAEVHSAFPDQPYWYLGVLATDPQHAGRRLGRAVMAAGLERAQQDGLPAYLETATDANVAVYSGTGWQPHTVVPVTPELTITVMAHPA